METAPETHHKLEIVIFINGEKFDLDTNTVQVKTLITLGGGIPGEYELQLRKGEHGPVIETYTDPNQIITIKNGEHFTTKFTGPINPA